MGIITLAKSNPQLSLQAYGWNPAEYSHKSGATKSWQGNCGHIWEAEIKNRTNGQGCPYCTNRKVLKHYNDLSTTHPKIAAEAYNWDPSTVTAGSDMKANWKADCGHIWNACVKSRTKKKGAACPYCSNNKLLVGFNDLKTKRPDLALQASNWNPEEFLEYSHQKKAWKGTCGHVWESSINSRCRGSGCPYCAGTRLLAGFNDLFTNFPEVAREAYLWNPAEYTAKSGNKMPFKCSECSHIWTAEIKSRTSHNFTNCPNCSVCGFKKNKNSYVYLIEKENLRKIGIGNAKSRRLDTHVKNGWRGVDVIHNLSGLEAAKIEYDIIKYFKEIKIPMGIISTRIKFNGYTECWDSNFMKESQIKILISLARNNKLGVIC